MTHEEKIAQWIGPGKIGTEIGPGTSPVPGLDPRPIYVDCFKSFGTEPNRADFYGHACALPFHDHALDYVVASHVLEHVANPVAALAEWYRVVRPGGVIYLVVPHRPCTWDHPRALTTVAHLLDDGARGTTACDATHIDEFAQGIDWARFNPATPEHEIADKRAELARGLHETVARGEDINIHFHTFESSNLRELLETLSGHPVRVAARWARGAPRLAEAHERRRLTARDGGADAESRGSKAPRLHPTAIPGEAAPQTAGPETKGQRDREENLTCAHRVSAFKDSSVVLDPRPQVSFQWELVDLAENFPAQCPNGILAVLRVHKGWRARADAEAFRLRTLGDPQAVLRLDAEPFADWAARTPGLGGVR